MLEVRQIAMPDEGAAHPRGFGDRLVVVKREFTRLEKRFQHVQQRLIENQLGKDGIEEGKLHDELDGAAELIRRDVVHVRLELEEVRLQLHMMAEVGG